MNDETFNPLIHQPPKYDIYGRQKEVYIIPGSDQRNILKDSNKIINPWDHQGKQMNPIKSRTELIAKRKLDNIPDKSYDLDGDGFVGGRDYVIAKRFDLDKDGKLNANEKKNAIQAIYNNVEDEYVWNIENQTLNRPARIMQKRGKILDLENYLPLQDTYPKHPLSDIVPDHKSLTQLKQDRLDKTKKEVNEKILLWEQHNPKQIVKDYSNKKASNVPAFTSMKQIKEAKNQAEREAIGLNKQTSDIKVTDKDPTLSYVYNPEVKTKADIKERLRKENQELSKQILSKKHIDEIDRLNMREEEIFELGYNKGDRQTYSKIKEQRRKENVDYHMKTFSNQTIGVHGHELPKFADAEEFKEFWKHREGWVENPKYISQVELLEDNKFWKKREEMKIKDHTDEVPEIDEFKKIHIPKEKEKDVVIKVNTLNHYKNFDPNNPEPIDLNSIKRKHIYRWTTLVHQFANQKFKKGRLFDNLDNLNDFNKDTKDVLSAKSSNDLLMKKQLDSKAGNKDKLNENQTTNKDNLFYKFSQKEQNGIKEKPVSL